VIFHFQALDGALKQVKALSPETSAMFFSVDSEAKKIVCLSAVPKVSIILHVSAAYQTL
jgi:alanyl-tRNA synthetase